MVTRLVQFCLLRFCTFSLPFTFVLLLYVYLVIVVVYLRLHSFYLCWRYSSIYFTFYSCYVCYLVILFAVTFTFVLFIPHSLPLYVWLLILVTLVYICFTFVYLQLYSFTVTPFTRFAVRSLYVLQLYVYILQLQFGCVPFILICLVRYSLFYFYVWFCWLLLRLHVVGSQFVVPFTGLHFTFTGLVTFITFCVTFTRHPRLYPPVFARYGCSVARFTFAFCSPFVHFTPASLWRSHTFILPFVVVQFHFVVACHHLHLYLLFPSLVVWLHVPFTHLHVSRFTHTAPVTFSSFVFVYVFVYTTFTDFILRLRCSLRSTLLYILRCYVVAFTFCCLILRLQFVVLYFVVWLFCCCLLVYICSAQLLLLLFPVTFVYYPQLLLFIHVGCLHFGYLLLLLLC